MADRGASAADAVGRARRGAARAGRRRRPHRGAARRTGRGRGGWRASWPPGCARSSRELHEIASVDDPRDRRALVQPGLRPGQPGGAADGRHQTPDGRAEGRRDAGQAARGAARAGARRRRRHPARPRARPGRPRGRPRWPDRHAHRHLPPSGPARRPAARHRRAGRRRTAGGRRRRARLVAEDDPGTTLAEAEGLFVALRPERAADVVRADRPRPSPPGPAAHPVPERHGVPATVRLVAREVRVDVGWSRTARCRMPCRGRRGTPSRSSPTSAGWPAGRARGRRRGAGGGAAQAVADPRRAPRRAPALDVVEETWPGLRARQRAGRAGRLAGRAGPVVGWSASSASSTVSRSELAELLLDGGDRRSPTGCGRATRRASTSRPVPTARCAACVRCGLYLVTEGDIADGGAAAWRRHRSMGQHGVGAGRRAPTRALRRAAAAEIRAAGARAQRLPRAGAVLRRRDLRARADPAAVPPPAAHDRRPADPARRRRWPTVQRQVVEVARHKRPAARRRPAPQARPAAVRAAGHRQDAHRALPDQQPRRDHGHRS